MKWARPTGSSRSSRKLKLHRSTRSFVGAATLGKERWKQESGLLILLPVWELLAMLPARTPWAYLGALMVQ